MPESLLSRDLFKFHTATIKEKSSPDFGKLIAEKMSARIGNSTDFYSIQNKKYGDLRKLARGKHDMKEFLNYLNIDGKQSFIKLDMTPPSILPKFLDIIIERFMELDERPTVTAVDDKSKQKKQRAMDESEFLMNQGATVAELQQLAGIPLVGGDQFVPSSYEELELYYNTEYRLAEEIKFEKRIRDTMNDVGHEVFKRSILQDLVEIGMAWARVYRDANGKKKYKRCVPENMVFNFSQYDDFRDVSVVGEIEKVHLSELRARYPKIDEKTWFNMFTSTEQGTQARLTWQDEYRFSLIRPYDDAVIEIFEFQVLTTEDRIWVEKRTESGKVYLDERKQMPQRLGENKELITKRLAVVYSGCYSRTTKTMIHWAPMENMIKPHYAMQEAFTNYVGFMPNNRDMTNESLVERCLTPIRMLSLIQLKKQHLIAKMRPDGLIIDKSALTGIDLGLGSGDSGESPTTLVEVFDQTGNAYYNGVTEDGEQRQSQPITPISGGGNAASLAALEREHQFWLNKLRDDLGTNEYAEGQAVNPKLGLGVMQNQIQAANRATNFIYRGYLSILEGIAKRIAIMDWYDVVEDGAPEYGIEPGEVVDNVFDISISMAPTDTDRNYIEQMAQTALSAGLITFEEAVKVRRIAKDNVKAAEQYLALYENRRRQQNMQDAQANSENQARIQQAVAQAKAQEIALQAQVKAQADIQKQNAVNEGLKTQSMGIVVNTIISEWMRTGKGLEEMPEEFRNIVSAYMQNVGSSQQFQAMKTEIEAQTMHAEIQQAQMEQQAQAEEGQPEEVEAEQ